MEKLTGRSDLLGRSRVAETVIWPCEGRGDWAAVALIKCRGIRTRDIHTIARYLTKDAAVAAHPSFRVIE